MAQLNKENAEEIFTLLSLAHKRIYAAHMPPRSQPQLAKLGSSGITSRHNYRSRSSTNPDSIAPPINRLGPRAFSPSNSTR